MFGMRRMWRIMRKKNLSKRYEQTSLVRCCAVGLQATADNINYCSTDVSWAIHISLFRIAFGPRS